MIESCKYEYVLMRSGIGTIAMENLIKPSAVLFFFQKYLPTFISAIIATTVTWNNWFS
jgi:hypothetical protein